MFTDFTDYNTFTDYPSRIWGSWRLCRVRTLTSPGAGSSYGFGTQATGSGSVVSARAGFAPARTGSSRPSRPSQMDPALTEHVAGGLDPEEINEMSHASAAALLDRVHHTVDPQVVNRVVTLVDTEGVDIIAQLWSDSDPVSLPGMLWRLYLLRLWMQKNSDEISYLWRLGEPTTTASSAIAGVDNPPDAQDIARTADSILSGAFTGDFAVALERAAAFTTVIVRGLRLWAGKLQQKADTQPPNAAENQHASRNGNAAAANHPHATGTDSQQSTSSQEELNHSVANLRAEASNLATTSHDFLDGARLWRRGRLE